MASHGCKPEVEFKRYEALYYETGNALQKGAVILYEPVTTVVGNKVFSDQPIPGQDVPEEVPHKRIGFIQ